jgi:hypothetical protein
MLLYFKLRKLIIDKPRVRKDSFHDPKSISLRRSEAGLFVLQRVRANRFGSATRR